LVSDGCEAQDPYKLWVRPASGFFANRESDPAAEIIQVSATQANCLFLIGDFETAFVCRSFSFISSEAKRI
jgi:hypothetical protein